MNSHIATFSSSCSALKKTETTVQSVWTDSKGEEFFNSAIKPLEASSESILTNMKNLECKLTEIKKQIEAI